MLNDKELRTYRSPIKDERGGRMIRSMMVFSVIILLLPFFLLPSCYRWPAVLLGLLPLISLVLALLFRWFYVQINSEALEIKSEIFPSWIRRYQWSEIQSIQFGYTEATAEFIYLYITSANRNPKRYMINLVGDEDLLTLIEELQRRGILVNTDKLQPLFERIEQRKREKAQGEALRRKAKEYEEQMHRERERMKR